MRQSSIHQSASIHITAILVTCKLVISFCEIFRPQKKKPWQLACSHGLLIAFLFFSFFLFFTPCRLCGLVTCEGSCCNIPEWPPRRSKVCVIHQCTGSSILLLDLFREHGSRSLQLCIWKYSAGTDIHYHLKCRMSSCLNVLLHICQ